VQCLHSFPSISVGVSVRWWRLDILSLVIVALGIFPLTALASPYDDHIANGSSLVRDGHYALAAAEFEAAYLLRKDPSIALQLGRIYLKLQQAVEAQRYCTAYLRLTGSAEPDPDREAKAHDCVNQAKQLMRTSTSPQKPMTAVKHPGARRIHQNSLSRFPTSVVQPDPATTPTELVSLSLTRQSDKRILSPPDQVEPSPPAIKTEPEEEVPAQRLADPVVTLKFRSAIVSPLVAEISQAPFQKEAPSPVAQELPVPLHKRWWLWSLAGVALASAVIGVTVATLHPAVAAPNRVDPLADVPMANQIVVVF